MESIRRKPHSSVVFGLITKLYQNNELIDCMLDSEGGFVKAHKVVLAACSPYFKNLFMDHKGMFTVPLKEIKYNDLKHILDLIYFGEIDVPVTDVESLKRTAKYLQLTPLKRFVSSNFSEKYPFNDASEKCTSDSETANYLTVTKKDEEDLCLHGTQGVNVTGKELSVNLQNAVSRIYSDAEREVISESGELDSSENELHILSSDVIGKKIKNEVPECLENQFSPFSFVSVPEFSLKTEEPADQDIVSSEAELNSQQFSCHHVVTKEADLDSESTLEMESDDEMYFSEISKTEDENSICSINSSSHYVKLSCQQLTRNTGGNSVESSEKVSTIDTMRNTPVKEMGSSGQCTDHQVFMRSEDLQVEFESTCDISQLNLKEEKPFVTSTNSQNIVEYDSEHPTSSEQSKTHLDVDNINAGADDLHGIAREKIEPPQEVVEAKNSPQNHDPLNCPQCVVHFRKKYEELLISPSRCDKANHDSPSELTRSSFDVAKIHNERQIRYNCEALFCPKPNHKLQMVGKVGKPYQCNICNASFIAHPHLLVHMRIHSGYRPYVCTVCSKSFNVAGSLKRHILTHTGEKPHLCRVCLKTFRTKDTLQSHFRTHTGERPYACNLCEKSYSTKTGLTLHLRSHTGEKPYVCCVCDKAFRLLPNLNGHMRVHTGEKPYPCNICNKSFRERNHLKRHALTHTGEKQFLCVICNKSYSRIRQLKSHMRAHRKENVTNTGVIAAQTNS